MNDIVGIDLGTTNSLIGIMEAGFPILLADANGERLTPSVVHFRAGGEPLVGRPASRMRALGSAGTIYSAKRFVGVRGDELRADDAAVGYELLRAAGQAVRVKAAGRDYVPEEVSALVLQKLKADAEVSLGRTVSRAVITVPAYFNNAQRSATKRAGELAGFTVERIVNEPTAAALAYGLDKLKSRAKIAVFDLGGGTFDISILELNNGVFEVLSTNGNTRLGGDDIDAALLASCEERIAADSLTPQQRGTLRDAVVAAKHRLSTDQDAAVDLPFFRGEQSVAFRGDAERARRGGAGDC
jgi:molecular chaperone DnaK